MGARWSVEKIWDWYDKMPWLRGCNFLGSDCKNRVDQWQELGFEERLKTADRELDLAAQTGFNTVRIVIEFVVWNEDHDGFLKRFDRYLDVCAKHGILVMIVFTSDCKVPKDEFYEPLKLGEQPHDWGYHGGRKHSPHGPQPKMGYHLLDEPDMARRHYEMAREIMEIYKHDKRIVIWDLYNEPGNSRRENITIPHLKKFFEIAREVDPDQPVTSCVWRFTGDNQITPVEQVALDNSDITSYHNYTTYETNIRIIKELKKLGRPIINKEWLGRVLHNTIFELFPLFYLEKIGCYNWGLVAGLGQYYEPWENTWNQYYQQGRTDIDFTKWFHDLYRPSGRPYDPKEIELIKRFCAHADKDFAESRKI